MVGDPEPSVAVSIGEIIVEIQRAAALARGRAVPIGSYSRASDQVLVTPGSADWCEDVVARPVDTGASTLDENEVTPPPAAPAAPVATLTGEAGQSGQPSPKTELTTRLWLWNYEFIDNRSVGGALWVFGDQEDGTHLQRIAPWAKFQFAPEGGRATGQRPAWWTAWGRQT